jgi:hypothetical protein
VMDYVTFAGGFSSAVLNEQLRQQEALRERLNEATEVMNPGGFMALPKMPGLQNLATFGNLLRNEMGLDVALAGIAERFDKLAGDAPTGGNWKVDELQRRQERMLKAQSRYRHIPSHAVTCRHIPSHTVTYRHIPSHTVTYRRIASHTIT